MKLIIDIPEEDYAQLDKWSVYYFRKIISEGTPLPKGHGRLIDGDVLRKEILSWGMNDYEPSDFIDEIDMADVIIEADKGE